jgi:hypothetical protein
MPIVSLVRDHRHLLHTNPVLAIAQREIRAAVAINDGFWRELQRRARSLRMGEGERQLFWQKEPLHAVRPHHHESPSFCPIGSETYRSVTHRRRLKGVSQVLARLCYPMCPEGVPYCG